MAILTDYVIPIVFVTVCLVFTAFFFIGLYFALKRFLPKYLGAWLKYKVLGKKYQEKDVQWCLTAYEMQGSTDDIQRFLLVKGYPKARIEEILFIYEELIKLKGGNAQTYGKQIKQSSLQTFKRGGGN